MARFRPGGPGPRPTASQAGRVGALSGLAPGFHALHLVYITMTGSAIAAQRPLALYPAEATVVTFQLSELCEQIAQEATAGLAETLSDPLDTPRPAACDERVRPHVRSKGEAWQRIPIPLHTVPARPRRVRKPLSHLSASAASGRPGKTALAAALCRQLRGEPLPAVLTNDIYTTED